MASLDPKHQARRVIGKARRINYGLQRRLSITNNYEFSVDNPRKRVLEKKVLVVEGWIIAKKQPKFTLRVRNNAHTHQVEMGIKRIDVLKTHESYGDAALYSGFRAEFEFEDGRLTIELDAGKGFKKLYSAPVVYGVERLPSSLYNKDLSNNFPEHLNLLENRQTFYYEDDQANSYDRHAADPRLVAMYLPQFHPFPENNKAWGRGFTEWTNVTTAQPRFVGHQQPILPKDLGFYDLRLESKIEEQIQLAKKHGIYGFCFYYYWFSGRKLMDAPIESVLRNKQWDFNFTICWANENWTKRWDGREDDVIIAQEYRAEDPLLFIKEVEHILLDKRYITEDGKPVLMVYRASELREPEKYVKVWREYFKKQHDKELHLVSFLSFDDKDPRQYGFDAGLDFAPLSAFFKNNLFDESRFPYVDVSGKLLDANFDGVVADYRSIALNPKLDSAYDFPTYSCLTPSWDNDARKKGKGFVYQNSSPDLYAAWLHRLIAQEQAKKEAPLIFINAWNEWAEGAILEPSLHLGHAVLNRTTEVLAATSHTKQNRLDFPAYGFAKPKQTKLAIIVHLYYRDLWPAIQRHLEHITEPFDVYVTLNTKDHDFTPSVSKSGTKVHTMIVPNRGRDVLPFLLALRRVEAAGYEYVLKLHSKKSKHREDGSDWFTDMLDSLIPNSKQVSAIINALSDRSTGIVGPRDHLVSLKRHMGSNQPVLQDFLKRIYGHKTAKSVVKQPERYPYFGGTMFWARVDALKPVLDLQLLPDDFQSEHGQIDGTAAHALERLFGAVCWLEKRSLYQVDESALTPVPEGDFTEKYRYAP